MNRLREQSREQQRMIDAHNKWLLAQRDERTVWLIRLANKDQIGFILRTVDPDIEGSTVVKVDENLMIFEMWCRMNDINLERSPSLKMFDSMRRVVLDTDNKRFLFRMRWPTS